MTLFEPLHSAKDGVSQKVFDPWKADDIIQIFFEKHEKYYHEWQRFLLSTYRDGLWHSEIQKIHDWFQERPEVFTEFRREILLQPEVDIPVPYNFDEMICIDAIYGGRVELDANLSRETSDDPCLIRHMELGFRLFYGLSWSYYLDVFKHAPTEVIDTLNKRATATQLARLTTEDDWFLSMDSQFVCE
jgi:hypothetical protein